MKTTALTLIAASTFQIFSVVNDFHTVMPQPVMLQVKEDIRLTRTRETLTLLGGIEKLKSKDLYYAAIANDIDPALFTCLIKTESGFDIKAVSKKGYKGLGQTPTAIQRKGFEFSDLANASDHLREKLNTGYSNGDMLKALQLYKGGKNNEALRYAENVLKIYKEIEPKLSKRS